MSDFKPLLAATIDPLKDPKVFEKLKFPLYLSPKIDGIRAIGRHNGLRSRKLEPIPNLHTQKMFGHLLHFDGELTVTGAECDQDCLHRTQSAIRTIKGEPDVTYWVFDWAEEARAHLPFWKRFGIISDTVAAVNHPKVKIVPHERVTNLEEFLDFEARMIAEGFEGIMARHPFGQYKWNRSAFREHILLKLKRFEDSEGEIVGFYEKMTNGNAAERNELGYTKRSSSQDGKIPADTLGGFLVKFEGEIIKVSTGVLKHDQCKAIWDAKDSAESWLRSTITFRHLPYGRKDAPRHARFVSRRDPWNM